MAEETILKWKFDTRDLRRCWASMIRDGEDIPLYFFDTFIPGHSNDILTRYQRRNVRLDRWEPAGTIEWRGIYAGIFILGLRNLNFADVTKKKRQSSKSRRFLGTDGTEYKWKCIGEDGQGFECSPTSILSKREPVAVWTAETQILKISAAGEAIMDDLVVTFIIHLWRRFKGVDFR